MSNILVLILIRSFFVATALYVAIPDPERAILVVALLLPVALISDRLRHLDRRRDADASYLGGEL